MKAKEFGPKYYLVKIYYKDQNGKFRTQEEMYTTKELAYKVVKYFREKKGLHYEDELICGIIKDVFTFTAKRCKFED